MNAYLGEKQHFFLKRKLFINFKCVHCPERSNKRDLTENSKCKTLKKKENQTTQEEKEVEFSIIFFLAGEVDFILNLENTNI